MNNFKKTQLVSVTKLVVLTLTMVFASCSSNNEDDVVKEQSITAANFKSYTSYSDNGYTNIQFGDVTNNSYVPIIKVENYNAAYNYSIVIKGDYLENEYKVALTFDKVNNSGDTILKFDNAEFDAVPDTYQAYILEEDSNTEVFINNVPNQGERTYYVYDADHSEYLYNLTFKKSRTDFTRPTSIYKNEDIYVGFSQGFSQDLKLEMVAYDTDLNALGRVDIHNVSTSYTNKFYGTDLTFITKSGNYIFQVEGTPITAGSSNTIKKSTYKTMTVNIN
ncbi:hypothetical protein [Polaribacter sp. R77954]|uniref:hypothetical protein n=1 Tax=Polaribacter sp. R77954 TaxID=3093870 RepID=UPI0037CC791C